MCHKTLRRRLRSDGAEQTVELFQPCSKSDGRKPCDQCIVLDYTASSTSSAFRSKAPIPGRRETLPDTSSVYTSGPEAPSLVHDNLSDSASSRHPPTPSDGSLIVEPRLNNEPRRPRENRNIVRYNSRPEVTITVGSSKKARERRYVSSPDGTTAPIPERPRSFLPPGARYPKVSPSWSYRQPSAPPQPDVPGSQYFIEDSSRRPKNRNIDPPVVQVAGATRQTRSPSLRPPASYHTGAPRFIASDYASGPAGDDGFLARLGAYQRVPRVREQLRREEDRLRVENAGANERSRQAHTHRALFDARDAQRTTAREETLKRLEGEAMEREAAGANEQAARRANAHEEKMEQQGAAKNSERMDDRERIRAENAVEAANEEITRLKEKTRRLYRVQERIQEESQAIRMRKIRGRVARVPADSRSLPLQPGAFSPDDRTERDRGTQVVAEEGKERHNHADWEDMLGPLILTRSSSSDLEYQLQKGLESVDTAESRDYEAGMDSFLPKEEHGQDSETEDANITATEIKSEAVNVDMSTPELRQVYLDSQPVNDSSSISGAASYHDRSIPRVAQTDSGYHTGGKTDANSVCSAHSDGGSLGLPRDFLQEFIAFFGDMLIERTGARAWAGYALSELTLEGIEHRLSNILKDYAVELTAANHAFPEGHQVSLVNASLGGNREIAVRAAIVLRRYRPRIAKYFCVNSVSLSSATLPMSVRLQKLGKQFSLLDKIGLLDKSNSNVPAVDEAPGIDHEEDIDDEQLYDNLVPIQEFLVAGKPFKRLVAKMRRELYSDDRAALDKIQAIITHSLSSAAAKGQCTYFAQPKSGSIPQFITPYSNGFYHVSFETEYHLSEFLKKQFGDSSPRLGSIVTISGSAFYAQATTCSEYLCSTWPKSGALFLATLQSAIDSSESGTQGLATGNLPNLSLEINTKSESGLLMFVVRGMEEMIVEVAQQICWIGAALRTSPFGGPVAYAETEIVQDITSKATVFNVRYKIHPLHPSETPCWLPLFSKTCIARGFPIPERGEQTGLEIPLQLMAEITGSRHAVEYEGGVVLKGHSAMLVPMKNYGDLIQWHLLMSECDARLSYRDVLKRCPNRALQDQVSLKSLLTTRAVVGWCSITHSILGSEDANYANIDYSGAEDAKAQLKFGGATLGIQQMAVAQMDFSLGLKDGKCHFQRNGGPFKRIISAAEKTPVVLYDTQEKRAWLVPALSVVLHIVQHRHQLDPFEMDGTPVKLFGPGLDQKSSRTMLEKSHATGLSDYEHYTLRDLILDIWSLLEFLLDQNIRQDCSQEPSVSATMRELLRGFEYMAVVEERSPFRQKQSYIDKTSGGWPALAKDIDALVLFANGFEDLIRPSSGIPDLCKVWRSVPKGKDYLAVEVDTLRDLFNVAGCRLTQQYLTSTRLQWHRGNSLLFEPCRKPGTYRCGCDRLQQIVPKSAIGRVIPPDNLPENSRAAVIFGESGTLFGRLSQPQPQKQSPHCIYSQPNAHIAVQAKPRNSGKSSSASSESSDLSAATSEATELTPVSSITSQTRDGASMVNLKLYSDGQSSFDQSHRRFIASDSLNSEPAVPLPEPPNAIFHHERSASAISYKTDPRNGPSVPQPPQGYQNRMGPRSNIQSKIPRAPASPTSSQYAKQNRPRHSQVRPFAKDGSSTQALQQFDTGCVPISTTRADANLEDSEDSTHVPAAYQGMITGKE